VWSTPLIEFWSVVLDPTKHRRMIDPHAAFAHKLFHIAVAQRVAQIPPHSTEDAVSLQVAPFEEGGIAHGRSPVIGGRDCLTRCSRSPAILATEPRWKVEHVRGFDREWVEMRKAKVTALVRWILVVSWMGVIFALSATPSLASPFEPIYDVILRAMLIAVLYACSDEWHQTLVPGRAGTVRDVVIDSLGIAGVLALASFPRVTDVLRRWFAKEVRGIRP
jgi:VanZ like family